MGATCPNKSKSADAKRIFLSEFVLPSSNRFEGVQQTKKYKAHTKKVPNISTLTLKTTSLNNMAFIL